MRQKKKFENKYPYRIMYLTVRGNWHKIDFMAKSDAEAIQKMKKIRTSGWIQYEVFQWQYMGCRRYRWIGIKPTKI